MDTLSEVSLPWPLDRETWKPMPGWDGYEVSCYGNVRSWKAQGPRVGFRRAEPRMLALVPNAKGYLRFEASDGKAISKKIAVHKAVLLAFCGPGRDGQIARHLDGQQTNNSVNNLCWGTIFENEADKTRHGTRRRDSGGTCGRSNCKLNPGRVREIRRAYEAGETGHSIAKRIGVHNTQVYRVLSGEQWAHVGSL